MARTWFLCWSLVLLCTVGKAQSDTSVYRLLVFEGSDWCTNCIRLEKKVLSSPELSEFADAHAIEIERIDFPQRKQLSEELAAKNEQLADQYGFDGVFPTVLLISPEGERIGQFAYRNQPATELVAWLTPHMTVAR